MEPVIQEELTGCGIASAAAIAGISYEEAKQAANRMGIFAEDESLWSSSHYVRDLLDTLGIETDQQEKPFKTWEELPDCALLATKWHLEAGKPFWHWVVFVREGAQEYVLDSKKSLKTNIRKDFARMKPKWFIEVYR
ncbi:hypothetical protein [Thiomicrorhabdus sp. 6S3-12]|uniref:hypothetical protein n=1 Tax=Thiomicrorhabdus sp. 6S3-12 TaxID=2819681 RepID=UPI001AAC916D|nr:hypothetical protein [Thiomicrorhabdus sp. 6S3-12]MBO1924211.1 hypothetical protein [Thiomicrorhabdus sp. 6S3-12]